MLLALQQFDPDAVRVLRERLAPPVPPADFAGTDDHLNAFTHQVGDGPVEVIDVEREVVEFLAVDIGRTESTSLGVPVQFEELVSIRALQRHNLAFGRRRPIPLFDDSHSQDLGVEPKGGVHVPHADACVPEAVGLHGGGEGSGPHNAHESPEGPSETAPPFRFNRYCLRALQPNLGMLPTESGHGTLPTYRFSIEVFHWQYVDPKAWLWRAVAPSFPRRLSGPP